MLHTTFYVCIVSLIVPEKLTCIRAEEPVVEPTYEMPKSESLAKNDSTPLPDAINYTTAMHSSASAMLINNAVSSKSLDVYHASNEVVFNTHMPVSAIYPHVQVKLLFCRLLNDVEIG